VKKKQTAVQWLLEQWPILESQLPKAIINNALQMEREQIIDAYNNGDLRSADLYYNETYGGHLIDHISDVSKMVGGQDESNH